LQDFNLIHGGNIYAHAKKLNISPSKIIDSSASLVPFSPPDFLKEALNSVIESESIKYYPERNLDDLREIIGHFHMVDPFNIMPGNGASELITWIGYEAARSGKNCLPSPGFVDYERALKCWNGKYFFHELPKKWGSSFPQEFPIKPLSEVIWITNPHNPSGQLWERNSLEKIVKEYRLVICDEAFLSMTPNGEEQSLIPLVKKYENLIVIRSLTKLFNMPGIRLGYAVGSKNLIHQLNQKRDPWPLNTFAIIAGKTLLENNNQYKRWTLKIHNWIHSEKSFLSEEISKIQDLDIRNSATNFFLIKHQKSLSPLIQHLADKGILIRDCSSFRSLNNRWARISLRSHNDNQTIADEMHQFFKK